MWGWEKTGGKQQSEVNGQMSIPAMLSAAVSCTTVAGEYCLCGEPGPSQHRL